MRAGRVPGLRPAAIAFAAAVVLGLGATGAQALWSLGGTVSTDVTAGAWAPQGVVAATVSCSRTDGSSHSDLTLTWAAADASGYSVKAVRNAVAVAETTSATTATLRLPRTSLSARDVFAVSITPGASGLEGPAAHIDAVLTPAAQGARVECTPAK